MAIPAAETDRDLARRLARTYGGSRDPWERVQEYRDVQRVVSEHPDKGSGAISNIVGLPRSRIRSWVDGNSKPDPVRGIQTATGHGWLTVDATDRVFRGLNVLVAWVYSGGSISHQTFVPRFVIDDRQDRDRLAAAMERVGVGVQWAHTETDARATEGEPAEHRSVLGRVLVSLGAPRGAKRQVATLPWYLDTMPRSVRLDWARTYVCNRGTERPDKDHIGLQIREERPKGYLETLGRFFETVATGDDYGVRVRGEHIWLDNAVARQLAQPPAFEGVA